MSTGGAGTGQDEPPAAGRWPGWRRPSGLVEQTRWLFGLCCAGTLILTVPGPLLAGSPAARLLLLAAAGALTACWLHRYLRGTARIAFDLVEAVGIASIALASPVPGVVFSIAFPALWFRAVYGSTRSVVVHGVALVSGLATIAWLWQLGPSPALSTPLAPVLSTLPLLLLTSWVARHLAVGLFAREQSQRRDAALAGLGAGLLGLTDREQIRERGWATAVDICYATPGLRLLVAVEQEGGLQVTRHVGEFRNAPQVLPRDVLPWQAPQGAVLPVANAAPLVQAIGVPGPWRCISAFTSGSWLLIGAAERLPDEAVVAVQSLVNQVALALRTSQAHDDLVEQASRDALTGLPNRAAFTRTLEAAEPAGLAVLVVDLDGFKAVNDQLGHAAGDDLLRHVGKRLRAALRPGDVCARLGGDEFAVLLHDVGGGAATVVADRIVERLSAPLALGEQVAQVGASIGLAYATPELSADQLLQRADLAMYAAKARGRNRVQIFDLTLLQDDEKAVFEAELHAATAGGQLVVHYQPIVGVTDGRCTALEALVRWQHPSRGLLAPDAFIQTAERTGAILDIGAHVLRQACEVVAQEVDGNGRPLQVHVNVSVAQLTAPGFLDAVRACLLDFGLADKQLVVEITESLVLDSVDARATLDALVDLGVALAIDDFGTGYSALTTLRTLPLDIVKIDKSFVAGCPDNPADHAVVAAIVQMAARLGMETVAEGVERPEQREFLRALGADSMQGFLTLRPQPAADVVRWLRAQPRMRSRVPVGGVRDLTPRLVG